MGGRNMPGCRSTIQMRTPRAKRPGVDGLPGQLSRRRTSDGFSPLICQRQRPRLRRPCPGSARPACLFTPPRPLFSCPEPDLCEHRTIQATAICSWCFLLQATVRIHSFRPLLRSLSPSCCQLRAFCLCVGILLSSLGVANLLVADIALRKEQVFVSL
ncbi:hypothetical protein CONLIGDRAFT_47671 [Coniochaeta ligniaria NRRL 30616]|uniref:Uncharacterized protein n=1 Tax=Coniochaeta ligniaria NRRL 30616 TaxID=1408157 RepID=A0A1J7J638_9PEZI|nr:hypothetical protein CONLIGDRAFT_47671 [Coniochaeta ligniaria NRRL 30616]